VRSMINLKYRLTTRSTRLLVIGLALALSGNVLIFQQPASATLLPDQRTYEFKITDVSVTGTVVRVRYNLPNECSWRYAVNAVPEIITPSRLKVRATGLPSGIGETCTQSPSQVSSIFEIGDNIRSLVDSNGNILWTRPGSVIDDFKVVLVSTGSRKLTSSITTTKLIVASHFEHSIQCKNGFKRSIRQGGTAPVTFASLTKGVSCKVTVTATYATGSKLKRTTPYTRVL